MLASVSASILALTVSAMLFFAWRSTHDLRRGIGMQRDAEAAFGRMRSVLHAASDSDVRIEENGELKIQTPGGELSFYAQPEGSDLLCRNVAGDEVKLVHGRLDSFVASKSNFPGGGVIVSIQLVLQGDVGYDATTMDAAVALRN
jgi:hypothetical protein